ncbi:hypothetical protein [Fimbriimonas ginsengisoli]|uniref:Uncharacterized protein n=1 Tax=Fimbriimonas ginsengisoli Gsoil 348 TaxID=661478 RepID=A0A068NYM1_FIMGI|nr:hypothetical protein [Fimbriimonas ginsengisoli]AIE87064.1 hypothetical protein OP10G_3696 [Fimbriimonas ginsengisoli Gsoil 348]
MRVRNKEIRTRRHRKEQVIKAAERALREQYGDKKAAPAPKPKPAPAPKKAAAKPAADKKAPKQEA